MPKRSRLSGQSRLDMLEAGSLAVREAYVLASKRGPDRQEQALLLQLLQGPRECLTGPVGRCLKRGWIAFEDPLRSESRTLAINGAPRLNTPSPVYRLTDLGRTDCADVNPPPRSC
jgi:hypothetical protein